MWVVQLISRLFNFQPGNKIRSSEIDAELDQLIEAHNDVVQQFGIAATDQQMGMMSTADKSKLDGIASQAEVNQNAFSNVKVGAETIQADAKTDTVELVAGVNMTISRLGKVITFNSAGEKGDKGDPGDGVPMPIGSEGQVLTVVGSTTSWANLPTPGSSEFADITGVPQDNIGLRRDTVMRYSATHQYQQGDQAMDAGGVSWFCQQTPPGVGYAPPSDGSGGNTYWAYPNLFAPASNPQAGQVLTGTGAAWYDFSWDYQHPISKRHRIIEEDFLTASANTLNGLTGAALSSGSMTAVSGGADHPGVVYLRDSTTANGGYAIRTDTTAIILAGGEVAEFIFQSRDTRVTAGFRMGFEDSFTIQTQPTDAACFELADASTQVIRGMCKNNAGPTYTDTTYTLTINTWYKGRITVNQAATSTLFELFSAAGALLWSSIVSANVPTGTGRNLGFGVVAGETTTDSASDIMYLDYLSLDINRSLTR